MIVQALQRHRALGEIRVPGAVFRVDDTTGRHLVSCGLARAVTTQEEEWQAYLGRELRTEPLTDRPWPMVVACLNIWNDLPALQRTMPTWSGLVDALVVADGKYTGGASTDGLADFLTNVWGDRPIQYVSPKVTGKTQNAKRTALLSVASIAYPDALLLIVDADEFVYAESSLQAMPEGDCGWVTVQSPMYHRPYGQPRLIRARPDLQYKGRHHWLYAGDKLLATHQYGGAGFEHRLCPVFLRNERGLGHDTKRWRAKQEVKAEQKVQEAAVAGSPSDRLAGARDTLRIAQLTTYDPGLVAFRLHTALNTTTPHASLFFRRGDDNPFSGPRQYDVDADRDFARRSLKDADVAHCHLEYGVLDALEVRAKNVVIHHHGTWLRNHAAVFAEQDRRACLRLVSNLELLSYGEGRHFLPNPVSVARLRRLRARVAVSVAESCDLAGVFRVAHSPSKRHLKGTAEFLSACDKLRAKNIPIEPVLIEGLPHSESLRLKATCDAAFDSFWLGIQCSGIEAAAMGLPVIAGDPTCQERYTDLLGHVPYTYANTEDELVSALERLVVDPTWRAAEADRVSAYVETWHDDAAVALRYLDLLDEAIGWRAAKTLKQVEAA